MPQTERRLEAFKKLGESWDVSPDLFEKLEDFVCQMYACKVSELRYQLFCAKRREIESSQLPACQACLQMHVMPANYQDFLHSGTPL